MTLLKRRLVNLLVWLTLILFVGIIGLWVSSYFWDARILHSRDIGGQQVACEAVDLQGGSLLLTHMRVDAGRWSFSAGPVGLKCFSAFRAREPLVLFKRVGWETNSDGSFQGIYINLPFWLLTATSLLPAAASVQHLIRRNRFRKNPNVCPTCGYDLRASPERCPECGTARSLL